MAVGVVTVAAGGLPVIDVTATKPALGVPVTEAVNGRGIPVTKVSLAIGGLPVTFVAVETGGGGGASSWVPVDAKIHIDFLGGTPQGRAWNNGAEVAINTLLGSDPTTVSSYGATSYNPTYLGANGYANNSPAAFIGAAKTMLLNGATMVLSFKNVSAPTTDMDILLMGEEGGDYMFSAGLGIATDRKGRLYAASDFTGIATANLANVAVGTLNGVATTMTALRLELAMNGGTAISFPATTADRPPGTPFVFALFAAKAAAGFNPSPSTTRFLLRPA